MPGRERRLPVTPMLPLSLDLPRDEACLQARDELERSINGFHQYALRYGGLGGIRDMPGLRSATFRPFTMTGDEWLYPSGLLQAGALLQSIAQGHIFADANKRTAFITCLFALHECGYLTDFALLHTHELARFEELVLRLSREGEDLAKKRINQRYRVEDIAFELHAIFAAARKRDARTFRIGRLAQGVWRTVSDAMIGQRHQ